MASQLVIVIALFSKLSGSDLFKYVRQNKKCGHKFIIAVCLYESGPSAA